MRFFREYTAIYAITLLVPLIFLTKASTDSAQLYFGGYPSLADPGTVS